VDRVRAEFAMKDMGEFRFFLGIDVRCTKDGFYLSQERYADDILDRVGMTSCKPIFTLIDAKGKL
jgi:hypothetical protein